MADFKVGDVAVLKSGGPEMTISGIGTGSIVFATWFNDRNQVESHDFYSECLNKLQTKK